MTETNRGAALRRALALCLYLAAAGRLAAAEAAPLAAEDELFARLFDAPPSEADDLFVVEAIEVEGSGFTREYLESFSREIRVGDRMRRSELEARAATIRERLGLSGMFYSCLASMEYLDGPADGVGSARLRIAVSPGSWWGIGFSPWDLSVGYANFLGEGKAGQLTLGLNAQSLRYLDPSIGNGAFYYEIGARHSIAPYRSETDPEYLGEAFGAEGRFGVGPTEDIRFGLCGGYLGLDSPTGYFLYPDYSSPTPAALASLGLSSSRVDYAKLGLELSVGEYGYRKRGGLGARFAAGIYGFYPLADPLDPVLVARADGNLRCDFRGPARLEAYARAEYAPLRAAGEAVPAPLRAGIAVPGPVGDRSPRGLVSGELAGLGRLSLRLDPVLELGLGFTSLGIVPELYYELALVSREAYSNSLVGQQDVGAIVKLAFAAPVNRVFGFGVAFGFPGLSDILRVEEAATDSSISFVFEIE